MKLIPHLEYEKLVAIHKTPQLLPKSASINLFNKKQAAAAQVLNLESISDDIKLALFNTTMKGLRANFEALTNTPLKVEIKDSWLPKHQFHETIDTGTSTDVNQLQVHERADAGTSTDRNHYNRILVHFIPAKLRDSAVQIMRILLKSPHEVAWDEMGQISFRGVKRDGAHIIDLLAYVLKPPSKSKTKPPIGISTFTSILKKLNVPTTLLGIHMRSKLQLSLPALLANNTPNAQYQAQGQEGEEEDEEEYEEMEEDHQEEGAGESPNRELYKTPPSGTSRWKNI